MDTKSNNKKMTDAPEKYNDYKGRIVEAIKDVKDNPIVLKGEIDIATLTDSQGVQRTPIAWLLYEQEHKMFYVTTVPKNKHIKFHTHDEDVFRYIMTGSLKININDNNHISSYTIGHGMWFVIKANISYEVYADETEGYTAIAAYIRQCEVARR